MNEELSNLIDELVAKGASDEEIDTVVKDYQSRQQPSQPEAIGQALEATNQPLGKGLYDLGRTIWSGLTDQTPITIAQAGEVVNAATQPTNVNEYIKGRKQIDFQKYVRDKDPNFSGWLGFAKPFNIDDYIDKYGNQFMIDNGLSGKIGEMEAKRPEEVQRRLAKEQYVQAQKKEAAQKLGGVTQNVEDVKDLSSALSVAGNFIGQAAYQIPLSFLTRGGSSALMESATLYDQQLDELAKKHGISREEVIKKNLDQPALNQQYAFVASALDAASAGSIMGAVREQAGKSSARQAMKSILSEAATEGLQGNLERAGAKNAAGIEFDPLSQENLLATANETIAGALGGGAFGLSGASRAKKVEQQATQLVGELSTGDPQLDAQIDEEAKLSPEQAQIVKENAVSSAIDETLPEDQQTHLETLQEENNAVQKQETTGVDVRQQTGDGQKVAEGNTQEQEVAKPSQEEVATKLQNVLDLTAELETATPERKQEIYKVLADARQSARQIAGEPRAPKKTPIQKQIESTVGISKSEPVTVKNVNTALKGQIKQHYKTLEEGVKKGQKLTNENLITKVQQAIKDAPLEPRQINSILTKVRKTNLFTPGSVSKLNTFIDKVTADAEYASKIEEAQNINKRLRRLVKSKDAPQNLTSIGKIFSSVSPEDGDIDKHLTYGRELVSALSSPTSKNYQMTNVEDVRDYIDTIKTEEEDAVEEATKEPNDNTRKQLQLGLRAAQEQLKTKDLSEFDDSEKHVIESLKQLDPESLDQKQLTIAVQVIDNVVENDDLSNTGKIEAISKSKQRLGKLKADVADIKKKQIRGVGKILGNTYQQFGRIFGDSGLAARAQEDTGIMDMVNAGSRVENQEIKLAKDLRDKIKEVNRKYKIDVNDIDNQVKLTAFSELYKNYGDDSHIPKVKKNIERTISEYEKAGETEDANAWKKAYSQFKDVKTSQDALDVMKKYPGLMEIWQFFNNRFNTDTNERLKKVTTELHNKPYVGANNYTHTGIRRINDTTAEKEAFGEGGQRGVKKVKPQQSKTSITATRNVPQGSGYSSNFNDTQLRGYRDSLYDIETSKANELVRQSIYSPEFDEIVGGKDNGDIIRKMITRAEELQRGASRATSNDAVKFLNEATGILRNLGSSRALASVIQPLKQVPSVWTRALANHVGTGSLDSFMKGIGAINLMGPNSGLKKLFDQYTVGVRGERLGGIERGESLSYRQQPGAKKAMAKLAEKYKGLTDDLSRIVLKPLTNSDVYAARTTWLGYYLQSLKEQGIKDVDLNTEYQRQEDPRRKQAAAYAEQKIAETQVPSNPATLAQLSRNENDAGWNFAKNILLPFSTFSINAKYRHIQDVERLIRNPNAKNAAAVGGDLVEAAAFAAIAYGISKWWKPLMSSLIAEITGIIPADDAEKKEANRRKAVKSILVNQVTPLAVGTLGESGAALLANQVAHIIENPNVPYDQWKKETGGFVYEPDKLDWGLFALGVEPIKESANNVVNLANNLSGEPVSDTIGDNKVEGELDENQAKLLALKTLFDALGAAGIGEAEIYNEIRKNWKEQLKESSKPEQTKRPKRSRVTIPRHDF